MGQSNSHNNDSIAYLFSFDQPYGHSVPAGRWQDGQHKRFKHPRAALCHVGFKFLSIITYLFGNLMGLRFITTFVLVIVLIAIDFWVVKNITGRLLTGLRWYNRIDDEGNSHWIYENRCNRDNDQNSNNVPGESDFIVDKSTVDATIFWVSLILTPFVWSLLLMVSLFRFDVELFMLVVLALVLTSTNLYGYARCQLGTNDIRSTLTQFVAKQVIYNILEQCDSTFRTNPELYHKAP